MLALLCSTAQLFAANGEVLPIFQEDFSGFSKGSESEPDAEESSSLSETIPADITHGYQWKGRGIHQAGGICAILSYDDRTYGKSSGWIQTPYIDVRLDNGNFTLRFKARSLNAEGDEIVLYLYDKYSSNYLSMVRQAITPEWNTYEIPFVHNVFGNRLAYIQIGAVDYDWLIDDVDVLQDVYDICAPHATAPKDVDFTQFTAQWDSVWSADSYLVSAYYYNEGEKTPDNRTYICTDVPSTKTEFTVTGTDKQRTYYFTVKAKNDKYTSAESNEIRVYVPISHMDVPVTQAPSGITKSGYTANWLPTERAMGYAIRHMLRHTATGDETYTIIHEDFETITEGSTEQPGYFYDYNLDKYSKLPGWKVNMGCTAEGMIGIDNYYLMYEPGMITSPQFDFSDNDGKYSVRLKVLTLSAGEKVYVDSYSAPDTEPQRGEYLMETEGEHTFTLDFTNGSETTYFTITFSAETDLSFSNKDKLFIDDLYVIRELKAGQSVVKNIASFEIEGDDTSYEFSGLEANAGEVFLYSVAAWSWSLDEEGIWGPTIYSDYSEPQEVMLQSSSVADAVSRYSKVYSHAHTVFVETTPGTEIRLTGIDGRVIAARKAAAPCESFTLSAPGILIISVGRDIYKLKI